MRELELLLQNFQIGDNSKPKKTSQQSRIYNVFLPLSLNLVLTSQSVIEIDVRYIDFMILEKGII